MRTAAAALLMVLATGCPDREIAKVDPTQAKAEIKDIPVVLNRNVDILFVVDDSGSMSEEQGSLATNFPKFIERLGTLTGGLPSVHIGVVSTDVGTGNNSVGSCNVLGDDGALLTNGCSGINNGAKYLEDIDVQGGGRSQNYTGNLSTLFACMAQLGTGGCGAEQPLESIRLALDPARNKNPGFLRDDAFLAVVIISDEDDCSTRDRSVWNRNVSTGRLLFSCTEYGVSCDQPDMTLFGAKTNCKPRATSSIMYDPAEYVQFLKDLKGDKQLIMAAITGDPTPVAVGPDDNGDPVLSPSCNSNFGKATPAVRTTSFLGAFSRQTFVRICDSDLSTALDEIAKNIVIAIGDPCIQGNLYDTNPGQGGVQPECTVSDVIHPDTAQEEEHILPACDAGHSVKPCWTLETDAVQCNAWPSKLKLIVDRGTTSVPSDTHVRAQCVTQ